MELGARSQLSAALLGVKIGAYPFDPPNPGQAWAWGDCIGLLAPLQALVWLTFVNCKAPPKSLLFIQFPFQQMGRLRFREALLLVQRWPHGLWSQNWFQILTRPLAERWASSLNSKPQFYLLEEIYKMEVVPIS